MKKRVTSGLLAAALLLTMTGCSLKETVHKLDAAEEQVEQKLDAAEERVEQKLETALQPTAVAAEPAAPLTEEQALQIALDHLDITADQTERLRTTYEIDDGVPQFDVEFHQGEWEYEFEIHAETGDILSHDRDHIYD